MTPAPKRKPKSKAGRGALPHGRPTALTPEVLDLVLQAKRAGLPDWQAAAFARVSQAAYINWRQKGIEELEAYAAGKPRPAAPSPYLRLIEGLEKAKADFVATAMVRIQAAGKGGAVVEEKTTETTDAQGRTSRVTTRKLSQPQWQADAWTLERSQPLDFGRTYQSVEVTGKDGGAVQVNSWAEIAKLAEAAAAAKARESK